MGTNFGSGMWKLKQTWHLDAPPGSGVGDMVTESPSKRPRLAAANPAATTLELVSIESLPENLVHDVVIPKTKCNLVIAPGHVLYIANRSDSADQLTRGLQLAGFYKGEWSHKKDVSSENRAQLTFCLGDSDDIVIQNNKCQDVGSLLVEKNQQILFKLNSVTIRKSPCPCQGSQLALNSKNHKTLCGYWMHCRPMKMIVPLF